MLFLGKELGRTLDEIMDLSILEVRMWIAYYNLEARKQKKEPMTRKARRG